jgi:hypothetical protein
MITQEQYLQIVLKNWTNWKDYDEAEKTPATFCNMFVRDCVTEMCGKDIFKDMTANDIYDYLAKYATKVPSSFGVEYLSMNGQVFSLIIAAQKGKEHGHVNIILPEKYVFSSKWNMWCPKCANIGGSNLWDVGINYAFKTPPDYYSLDFKKENEQ